jgi:serine/threonine protein kinase
MEILPQLKASLAHQHEIGCQIGRGGMATVYLARDVKHEWDVAIKVLNPDLSAIIRAERLHREIPIQAASLAGLGSADQGTLLRGVVTADDVRAQHHRLTARVAQSRSARSDDDFQNPAIAGLAFSSRLSSNRRILSKPENGDCPAPLMTTADRRRAIHS